MLGQMQRPSTHRSPHREQTESLKTPGKKHRNLPLFGNTSADTLLAKEQTQVKILFDEAHLYVLINAESEDKKILYLLLRRDFSSRNSDSVTLVLDTFNDGTNAFLFGTNPEGV